MPRLLMGVETEYGLAGIRANGEAVDTTELATRILEVVRRTEPHLPDARCREGVFLRNGGRLYVDCGSHPEFATPEAPNPWEAIKYVRAGERHLARAAAEVAEGSPEISELLLLRANVDYSEDQTTWGCHESYLHRCAPEKLAPELIPHLVSRVAYSGAGGFRPNSEGGDFTLSPRAWLLCRTTSGASTHSRGIFHNKEESLCGRGYRRLHVLSGDTICSDIAAVLKVGTTALITAAVDQGERPGEGLALLGPVASLRAFISDPTCKAKATLCTGRRWSALEIQRCYLGRIERLADSGRLPDWSHPLCRMWRRVLDMLEDAPESAQTSLDWAIKLALFREWSKRPPNPQTCFIPDSPKAQPFLLEADLRFGQLGGNGIFEELDRSGILTHRLLDDDEVERALQEPPSAGRGKARGKFVKRHGTRESNGSLSRFGCDWASVVVEGSDKYLDFSDPFVKSAKWRRREE